MIKLYYTAQLFFSLLWQSPDAHLPEKYRQGRISFVTALQVAYSWYTNSKAANND